MKAFIFIAFLTSLVIAFPTSDKTKNPVNLWQQQFDKRKSMTLPAGTALREGDILEKTVSIKTDSVHLEVLCSACVAFATRQLLALIIGTAPSSLV